MSENVLDANRENCAYRGNKHQTTKQEKRSKKDPLEKKRFWKRRWVINSSEPQRKERNYYVKRLLSPNL